ncbi:hypothetical protein RJT34_22670 [Clitoria ternatea]|uniref:Uncharacterized protein n=1 Tax=Clitoria ternatea TaxID=43366 RepID=A0AAN9FKG2_CLITE
MALALFPSQPPEDAIAWEQHRITSEEENLMDRSTKRPKDGSKEAMEVECVVEESVEGRALYKDIVI